MRQRLIRLGGSRRRTILDRTLVAGVTVALLASCSGSAGSPSAATEVEGAPTIAEVIAHPDMAGLHRSDVVATYENDVDMIWGGDLDEFIEQERHYSLVLAQCRVIYEIFATFAETGEVPARQDPYDAAGYPERRGRDDREFSEIDDMASQYRQVLMEGDVEAVENLLETCIAHVDPDDPDSPLIRDQVGLLG